MAQITIDDYLTAISQSNSIPSTPSAPRGSVTGEPQDIKDAETQAAFTAASGAASDLIGVLRRYKTGAASKAEADAALKLYQNKLNALKIKNPIAAANIEVSAFGSPITAGLGQPTIQSDAKGKTKKISNEPEETPIDSPTGQTLNVTGTDRYPNYTYQNDGSVVGKDGIRQYIVTLPVSDRRPGGPVTNKQQPFDTPTKARDAFIKSYYGSDNGINRLKTELLQSNWIKQSQLADGSWVGGLDDFIADYTAHVVREDKYGTATDSISITDYLAQKKPQGQSTVQTYRTYSTRGEAKRMFNEYMINLLGRPGTEEENTEYFNILNKEENKAVSTIVDGTKRGSNLDDADRVMLAVKVAKKALKGTTVESILNSKTGSQAANDISSLQSTASAYGIELDAATALRYVAEGLGTENSLNKQKERLRLNAMQLYPTFKEHIQAGGTVKDIADVYAYARQKKLGVVIPNSTQDKKVMAAALAGKSIADYDREMQGEDIWALSEEAGEIGADFTQQILRSFGFGG